MSKNLINFEYRITEDGSFQDAEFGHTKELNAQFDSLNLQCKDNNNYIIIDKLKLLIEKFPKSPVLKNYLCQAYFCRGDEKKAKELNEKILIEHPNYLFAKINKAHDLIYRRETEKIPSVLGERLELKALYPNRDLFHISEVVGYLFAVTRYFIDIGDFKLAENRFEILKKLDSNNPMIQQIEEEMLRNKMKFSKEANKDLATTKSSSRTLKKMPTSPTFINSEIKDLYAYDLDIPVEKLQKILALPRISLISDLEKILEDAVNRYQYYVQQGGKENEIQFPAHAIFLLTELKAYESLPKIISFLGRNTTISDYWLFQHRILSIWRCFYCLCLEKIDLLKDILLSPEMEFLVKNAAFKALCQIAVKNPSKRSEVVAILKEVLQALSLAKVRNNIEDEKLINLSLHNMIDANLIELLPDIEMLFEKGMINESISGSLEKIKQDLQNAKEENEEEIMSIYEFYENWMSSFVDINEPEEAYPGEFDELYGDQDNGFDEDEIVSKIGRNDPCHCGSGKKFKKCHGK